MGELVGRSNARMDIFEKAAIFEAFEESIDKGYGLEQTYRYLSKKFARSEGSIQQFIRKLRSTTKLAEAELKANAHKLVEKVLDKADVDQAIDILGRPNIGVLAPIQKGGEQGGIFVSVSANSCGAVQVGVGVPQTRPGLPAAPPPVGGEVLESVALPPHPMESRVAGPIYPDEPPAKVAKRHTKPSPVGKVAKKRILRFSDPKPARSKVNLDYEHESFE